jgi:hypothetical protein
VYRKYLTLHKARLCIRSYLARSFLILREPWLRDSDKDCEVFFPGCFRGAVCRSAGCCCNEIECGVIGPRPERLSVMFRYPDDTAMLGNGSCGV